MALPPLPATNTQRYRLNYMAAQLQHSIVVHIDNSLTPAAAALLAADLANLLKPLVHTDTVFQSVDFAFQGSNVFNPVASMNVVGTVAGSQPAQARPVCYSFVGRSVLGRKTRLFLFGVPLGSDANWRVTGTEYAPIATAVTALNAGTGGVKCVDGSTPLWRNYVNLGAHDHFVKRIRRTG